MVACAPAASSSPAFTVTGIAVAGPTCPVVTDPPQSGCDDRPVAGAELVIIDDSGNEMGRVTTGEAGRFTVQVPAGAYRLEPQPVDGLMGTASELPFTVSGTGQQPELVVIYDTGIR